MRQKIWLFIIFVTCIGCTEVAAVEEVETRVVAVKIKKETPKVIKEATHDAIKKQSEKNEQGKGTKRERENDQTIEKKRNAETIQKTNKETAQHVTKKQTHKKSELTYSERKNETKSNLSMIDLTLPHDVSKPREKQITHIVIHFTSNAGIDPKNPYDVNAIRQTFIHYGVSAYYIVGRNGEIYELVREDRVAYHAGKGNLSQFPEYKDRLNDYSIGIEVRAIGTKEEMSTMVSTDAYDSINKIHIGYTEEQYSSIRHLLSDIIKRNPSIKRNRNHIVGHDEYALGRKKDPGSLFDWSKIGF